MPIGIQYGAPRALGRAALAAGAGEYQKYLDQLALQQEELRQGRERLDISRDQLQLEGYQTQQRERLQRQEFRLEDLQQRRRISLEDRSRREQLLNRNRQIAFREVMQNRRLAFQQRAELQQLAIQEQQASRRLAARLYQSRVGQLTDIAVQRQQQVLDHALRMRRAQAQAILQSRRAAIEGMQRQAALRQRAASEAQVAALDHQQQLDEIAARADARQRAIREEARMRGMQVKYTPGQKQEIARLYQEIDRVQGMARTGEIAESLAQQRINDVQQRIEAIQPRLIPSEDPQYPEGRGVGDIFTMENSQTKEPITLPGTDFPIPFTRDEKGEVHVPGGFDNLLEAHIQAQSKLEETRLKETLSSMGDGQETTSALFDTDNFYEQYWRAYESVQTTGGRDYRPSAKEVLQEMKQMREVYQQIAPQTTATDPQAAQPQSRMLNRSAWNRYVRSMETHSDPRVRLNAYTLNHVFAKYGYDTSQWPPKATEAAEEAFNTIEQFRGK